jgi:hypothetical protein
LSDSSLSSSKLGPKININAKWLLQISPDKLSFGRRTGGGAADEREGNERARAFFEFVPSFNPF